MERKVLAICATWEDEENLNLTLSHLITACRAEGFLPVCITFDRAIVEDRGEAGEREFLALFELKNLSGIILFGEMIRSDHINQRLIRMASEKQIPAFMLERTYEDCINLQLSYDQGFEDIARHIILDHGCHDIVMIAGSEGNVYSEARIAICRKVLAEAGVTLSDDRILYGQYYDVPTLRALKRYYASGGSVPQAFLCANDAMALAVCEDLTVRGLRVPEDVIVSGFDGTVSGERHEPTISTEAPDFAYMFQTIFTIIRSWNTDMSGKTQVLSIPFMRKLRQSCGCDRELHFDPSKRIAELTAVNLDYSRHIREMGRFIRRTLSMDALDTLSESLPRVLSEWPDPYYCLCALDPSDHAYATTLLHGQEGVYTRGTRFQWAGAPLPDYDEFVANEEICIALAHLLQTREETMGYIVCGLKTWSLRDEQRFEEQALFMSSVFNAVMRNHRLKEANLAMQHMAERDFLTGLYNRRGFFHALEEHLQSAATRGQTLTLCSLDLDWLKKINDAFGHQEGDHAIQSLASALEEETKQHPNAVCARFGGDEYALALFSDAVPPHVDEIRNRIVKRAGIINGDQGYVISASIGAVSKLVTPDMALQQMLVESDQALYADKATRHTFRT